MRKERKNMSNEVLEMMVEEVMRMSGYNSYEDYNNEELREKFRRMLREEDTNASSENVQ
jgi:hypothetical protein